MFNEKIYMKQYRQRNKNRIKEYAKKYRVFNKEKIKELIKKWYSKNKNKINEFRRKDFKKNKNNIREKKYIYNKNYCIKNINKVKEYQKEYQEKNKDILKNKSILWRFKNKNKISNRMKQYYREIVKEIIMKCFESWEGYIPKETNCEICGKKIYFNNKDLKNAIHFDHKNEHVLIKTTPTRWLYQHTCIPENQKIWESCNFGKLCLKCNRSLPTKNRIEFLTNITRYILNGEENREKNIPDVIKLPSI